VRKQFFLLSLGCPKNTVDSEAMRCLLEDAGWASTDRMQRADLLIVNTCGFIESARSESYAALRDLAQQKRPGQQLLAVGCLSQRTGDSLRQEARGVDAVLGTRRWVKIVDVAETLLRGESLHQDCAGLASLVAPMRRQPDSPSAYLKIADGCSAPCAFCTIPLIKGPQQSKTQSAILGEAQQLVSQGVREVILVAQDTTAYGRDLGLQDGLPNLIEAILDEVPQLPWLRLMYAYPQHVTPALIDTMAAHPQVCHYLDLPLQHASPSVLRRMHRPTDMQAVRRILGRLRGAMPDIALRTTYIVGYPGETDVEFQELLDWLQEACFDRVGIFVYSREEGTPAAQLPDQVSAEVAQERYQEAMELQRRISEERNRAQIGRSLDVLVEGVDRGISVGRSYRDAPEIDGYVLLTAASHVGDIVPARITQALDYDLLGEPSESAPTASPCD